MFAHDKIRDVVYAEAGSTRRRLFHHRAFDSLQASSASPAELAHHAFAAGPPAGAARFSMAAGVEAKPPFAVRAVTAHYAAARRIVRKPDREGQQAAQGRVHLSPSCLS